MEKGSAGDSAGLLFALTNAQYYRTYCDTYYNPVSEEQRNQATQDTIQIISKFIGAMKECGVKFDREKVQFEANNSLFGGVPMMIALRCTSQYDVWGKLSQMGVIK